MKPILPSVFCGMVTVCGSCTPSITFAPSTPVAAPGDPEIEISTEVLEFGDVDTLDESKTLSFVVRNTGEGALNIDGLTLQAKPAFTLMTSSEPFVLAGGEEREVSVSYTPTSAAVQSGLVQIDSNDEDEAESFVSLTGRGAGARLLISPDPLDFETVLWGCSDTQIVTVANEGFEDLTIDDWQLSTLDDQLTLALEDYALPLTVAPSEHLELDVTVHAQTPGDTSSLFTVTSNDPRGVVQAEQSATVEYAQSVVDEFEFELDPPIDILFAINPAFTMLDEREIMAEEFDVFLAAIDAVTHGWHFGIVTGSACMNGGVITADTPHYEDLVTEAILSQGISSDYPNALLAASDDALSMSATGECNEGFLQPNTPLHVFIASHIQDKSDEEWPVYVDNYRAQVTVPDLVSVSAVIDINDVCGLYDDEDNAAGYREASVETGGIQLDICSLDWVAHAQALHTLVLDPFSRYPLSQIPVPDSIEVSVDAVNQTDGWTWESDSNEIVFDPTPPSGTTITIAFGTAGC